MGRDYYLKDISEGIRYSISEDFLSKAIVEYYKELR